MKSKEYYSPSPDMLLKAYGGDIKAARREYSRIRNTARKRGERMEKAGYGTSVQVREVAKLKPLKEIKTVEELARLTAKAYRQVTSEKYTVKGVRASFAGAEAKVMERFNYLGLKYVKKAETDVLFEVARKSGFLGEYGSEQVLRIYANKQNAEKKSARRTDVTKETWRKVVTETWERIKGFEEI